MRPHSPLNIASFSYSSFPNRFLSQSQGLGFLHSFVRSISSRIICPATMSSSKMIVLKSSDGETFAVEEAVALESQIIKQVIENNYADTSIPLPKVTSNILAKVIEYCKNHVEAAKSSDGDKSADEDLKSFDADFVKVDQDTLFDLIRAANYLQIQSLLDLTCQTVADMIKGKTPGEIFRHLNIKNDFTPEEEKEIRRENAWAFE